MSTAKEIIKNVGKTLNKHWPKIATAFGGILLVTGGYLLGTEIPKFKKELEDKKAETGEEIDGVEKGKIAAKHFAAPASALIGGTLFLVASAVENDKRIAKLGTAACAISEMASKNIADYVDAAKDVVGEEKAKEIDDKVVEKKLKEAPKPDVIPEFVPEEGKYWCYDLTFDGLEGKPFLTTKNTLDAAVNDINRRLNAGDEVTLNEAYELIGHGLTGIGEAYGWRFDDCFKSSDQASFDISTTIMDGKPVYTIRPNAKLIDPGVFGYVEI